MLPARFLSTVFALTLVAFGPSGPARAAESGETFGDAGWVSLAVDLDGTAVTGNVKAAGVRYPISIGWRLYTAFGDLRAGSVDLEVAGERGTYVDARAGDTEVRENALTPHGNNPVTYENALQINSTSATYVGRFHLLLWGAGDMDTWSYSLGGGISVAKRDAGPDAHFFRARDFEGAAHVAAYPVTGLDAWAYGGRAEAPSTLRFHVDDTLIGMYVPPFRKTFGLHAVTLPSGTVRACECHFSGFSVADRHGPGEYTFHLAGVGVGATIDAEVYVILLDARLPA